MYVCLTVTPSVKSQTRIVVVHSLKKIKMLNLLLAIKIQKSKHRAMAIARQWRKESRGKKRRINKGIVLSLINVLTCYCPDRVKTKYKVSNKICKILTVEN